MAGNLYDPLESLNTPSVAPTAPTTPTGVDLYAPLQSFGASPAGANPQPAQVPGEDLYSPLPSLQQQEPKLTETEDGREAEITSTSTMAPGRERKAQLTEEEKEAKRKTAGFTELASGGLQRGWQSAKAIPDSLTAVYQDLAGDSSAAIAAAQRAKAIEDEAPEALWELKNVRGLTDFGMWLTERLGENAINLLGAATTGGAGGIVGSLGARGLALSAAGRAALVRAGAGTGAFASSAAFETSGTMLEQFEASKGTDVHGGISLAAGVAKGALELPTMIRLFSPMRAGSTGAASFSRNWGKTVATEALTELAQEEIDILARKYTDPSYDYFGSPALWRRAEAFVAGGAIGGIVGGPSAYLEAKKAAEAPDESGLLPGQQKVVREAGVRVRGVTRDVEPRAAEEPGETPPPGAPPGTEPVPENLEVLRLLPGQNQVAVEDAFSRTVQQPGPAANEFSGQMSKPEMDALFRKREEEEADPQSERNIRRRQVEADFDAWEAVQREHEAERRRAGFHIVSGPVTETRNIVLPPPANELDMRQSTEAGARQDIMAAGPLLKTSIPNLAMDEMMDMIEADTPRYAIIQDAQGNYGQRLYTDTDLEFVLSQYPQAAKPRVVRIHQQGIQPAAIAADVFDLPDRNTGKVYFVKSVPREMQVAMFNLYDELRNQAELSRPNALISADNYRQIRDVLEKHYNKLLSAGMRVVPSRGASFYYDGRISGDEVSPAQTSRSRAVNFMRVETGVIMMPHTLDVEYATGSQDYVAVAVDLNKFRPGEISALPWVHTGQHFDAAFYSKDPVKFTAKVKEADKEKLKEKYVELVMAERAKTNLWNTYVKWSEEGVEKFRQLMQQGVYLQPYPFTNELVTLKRITPQQVTFGFSPRRQDLAPAKMTAVQLEAFSTPTHRVPFTITDESVVTNGYNKDEYFGQFQHTQALEMRTEQLQRQLKAMKPIVDRILKSLGITGGVLIEAAPPIKTSIFTEVLGDANMSEGRIRVFATPMVLQGGARKVFDTLMHELGHMITFHYYSKLPYEVKKQLEYAYQKALLVRRTGNQAQQESVFGTGGSVMGQVPDGDIAYFSSFPEWLAEQFRRWSSSQEETTTLLDKHYKEVAQHLEQFYREWEKAAGPALAQNITQPSYFFSAVMDYLRKFSVAKEAVTQKMRQQRLYELGQDVLDSPVMLQVAEIMANAVASMGNLFPPGVLAKINERLDPALGAAPGDAMARYLYNQQINLNLIEIAVGTLQAENARSETRVMVAHELVHAYRQLGIMPDAEFEALYRFALKDGKQLSPAAKAAYAKDAGEYMRSRVGEYRTLTDWKNAENALAQKWIKEETVAYYIGSYANTGFATAEAKPILEKFLAFIKRSLQLLMGGGWQTREQLLRSFFSGEMLERSERSAREAQVADFVANMRNESMKTFDSVRRVGNYFVTTDKFQSANRSGEKLHYYWFEEDPNTQQVAAPVGVVRARHRGVKGYDIEWIESRQTGLGPQMIDFMEKDTGRKVIPSGRFTPQGFQFMKFRYRHLAKYYVRHLENGDYFSPNEIDRQLRITRSAQALVQQRRRNTLLDSERRMYDNQIEEFQKKIDVFEEMKSQIPADIYKENQHLLEQMFMLPRNYYRDEVQGEMIKSGHEAEENKLLRALGEAQPGAPKDAFTLETEHQGKVEAYRNGGIAPQTEVRYMRKIVERVAGLETNEENKKYLRQSGITQEADRIGWFTKMYWGLHQLVWRNPHVLGLLDYMQFTELFNQTISRWHNRADEVARAWDQKNTKRKEISDYLFWAMEMEYLTPQEAAAGVVRHPHRFEREQKMRQLGLSPDDRALIAQIEVEFGTFLNEVEQVSIQNIQDTVASPVAASAAIMEVQAEMQKLRAKPYFPITRFGTHTITVRDGNNNRIVKHFEVFDSHWARDAAIADISSRYPGDEVTIGRVPEAMFEFMGLPAPLIRQIREKMPNLDPQQQAWLENFERLNLPDRSFRKRWKPKIGTPGHSMDGFRVYVHYFMHGSRYLARMKYGRQMSQSIGVTRGTIDYLPNSSKRRLIVDYMTDHYNYIMEGGKDWSKFKAFVSWWQLGFSPAAAAMNLTQTPVVSWPFLAGTFGTAKGTNALLSAMNALRRSRMQNPGGTGNFFAAWEEMKQQGRIDIGQAAELGSYAHSVNLMGLLAGNKRQKFYRNVSYYGMWMFQKAEEANRSIMFKAAWELAMQNPNNKRLKEIEGTAATAGLNLGYSREIADLRARLNFTQQEAIAFIFAKEAIDQTQGIYAPYSRPPFMRNPLASTILIFYQYMQMMSYVYRYNPGTVQLMLISLALYGMLGLPGAEDLNEMVRFLSQKLFGKDFDPKMAARKHVVDITKGTVLEEVGPDLFLHGISRYGFGLGLLPEGWALGKFDASANGSLGKTVPGLYEALHGANVKNKPDQYISDLMQRLSGAGFGFAFNFLQWANENPGSADSKKWESMLPRSARSVAKAYRMYSDEGETTRSGARVVKFDIQDPEDLAALGFQAIGFASTKVSATWELLREQRDLLQIYQAERGQLYGQMARAVQSKDQQVVKDVTRAILEYNAGVRELDPSMQISTAQVMQAMRNRERAKQLQEQLLPAQRSQMPVARRLQEMFPNVKAERLQFERQKMPQAPTE